MICKKCGGECERRDGLLNWRGISFPSWLCVPCNALYEDEENSMIRHVARAAAQQPSRGDGPARARGGA